MVEIASAANVAQTFSYQGRLFNAAGTAPLSDVVDIVSGIYDPSGNCLLYEEHQTGIDLTATSGVFAISVGSVAGDAKRTASDPGLAMAKIFANSGQVRAAGTNCASGYSSVDGDLRKLRVTVTPHSTLVPQTLSPDYAIHALPSALVAQTIQGMQPSDFIQVLGGGAQQNVSLANLITLTGGADASALHTHGNQYLQSGGSTPANLGSGGAYTSGNFGIGTASVPTVDLGFGGGSARSIQVQRNTLGNSAGNNLTVSAGGATTGGTDQNGGSLILSSGTSTGAGGSDIRFNTASSGSSGAADNAPSTKMILTSGGHVGIGTTTPGAQLEVDAASAATSGVIVKGAASQNANLLSLQNSAGTVLAAFDSAGNLSLPADPSQPLQACTKQYVDNKFTSAGVSSFNTRTGAVTLSSADVTNALGFTPLKNSTDTMTGVLTLSADPTIALGAATKQYVDTAVAGKQPTGNYITALTSDVSASGAGSAAATVNSVGGSSAANLHSAELAANAATNLNTASTIVKRDPSGNFSAGTITANLTGSASANVLKSGDTMTGSLILAADPTAALEAATKQYVDSKALVSSFNGRAGAVSLTSADVTGALGYAPVSSVVAASGSPISVSTVSNVATVDINATSTNTASAVVKRDASGNFAANVITANVDGVTKDAFLIDSDSTGASATAYVVFGAASPAITSVSNGDTVSFVTQLANGASPTLQVGSSAAKPLYSRFSGAAVNAGDLQANKTFRATYDTSGGAGNEKWVVEIPPFFASVTKTNTCTLSGNSSTYPAMSDKSWCEEQFAVTGVNAGDVISCTPTASPGTGVLWTVHTYVSGKIAIRYNCVNNGNTCTASNVTFKCIVQQ